MFFIIRALVLLSDLCCARRQTRREQATTTRRTPAEGTQSYEAVEDAGILIPYFPDGTALVSS